MKLYRIIPFLCLGLLMASCTKRPENKEYKAVILDEKRILHDSTIQKITNFKYPVGFYYMVRTVDSADIRKIGVFADECHSKDKHVANFFDFADRGVYIFVSKHPALIQLRMGDDIRVLSNWNGISSGKEYLQIQKIAMTGEIDKAVLEMVNFTSQALPKYCKMSKIKYYIYDHFATFNEITSFITTRFEFTRLSPDSFYSKYVLKPIFEFHLKFKNLWVSFILLFSLAFIFIYLLNKILFDLILFKFPKAITNSGKFIVSNIVTIAFLIPAINSRGMLLGSRMEDRFKLEQLHINGFENIVFPDGFTVTDTPWWLAIIFVVLFLINKLPKISYIGDLSNLPDEKQAELYNNYKKLNPLESFLTECKLGMLYKDPIDYDLETYPYTFMFDTYFFYYFLLGLFIGLSSWLFLPKSFVVVSIYLLIITIVIGFTNLIVGAFRETK